MTLAPCGCSLTIPTYSHSSMGVPMRVSITNVLTPPPTPLIIFLTRASANKIHPKIDIFECGSDSFNARVSPVSLRFLTPRAILSTPDSETAPILLRPLAISPNPPTINFYFPTPTVSPGPVAEWSLGRVRWAE